MWPHAETIRTPRLVLEPLTAGHAAEMLVVLADPRLHAFTGGEPPTAAELEARYRSQARGVSPDGSEAWLNWVVRRSESGAAAGFVQATVTSSGSTSAAEVAWVIGSAHQGEGLAGEAAAAMLTWLGDQGVGTFTAHIHPDHAASAGVAARCGMVPTDSLVDGEVRWVSTPLD